MSDTPCLIGNSPSEPDRSLMEEAVTFYGKGLLDKAHERASLLVKGWPGHGFGWKLLGAVLGRQGLTKEALIAMQRAVEYLPSDVEARCNLAAMLFSSGAINEAKAEYDRAMAVNSAFPPIWQGLAECYYFLNMMDLSEIHGKQALQFKPDHPNTNELLGRISMAQGRLSEAIAYFRLALEGLLKRPCLQNRAPQNAPFNQNGNEKILWSTLAHLAKSGVKAFPHAGTLLGLEREGTLLSFDKDLDIGLPFSSMAAAKACLLDNGWRQSNLYLNMTNPLSFQHLSSGVSLDLCGISVDEESGMLIGGFWQNGLPWDQQRILEYPQPLSIKQVKRDDDPVWLLERPQEWLDALYGDWRSPDPVFDTTLSAKNLRSFSLLCRCYAFNRIAGQIAAQDANKALALTRQTLAYLPDDKLLRRIETYLLESSVIESDCAIPESAST